MFDKISGLPAHPLLVHAAVVLVPLLILVTLGYALAPRLRSRLDWAVASLAVAAPLAVLAARLSGTRFKASLFDGRRVPAGVLRHQHNASLLLVFVLILGGLSLLMVLVGEGRRRDKIRTHGALPLVITILAVASVVPTGLYVFWTGESGATAVWNPGK
jgi:uncharacterized membrane protein